MLGRRVYWLLAGGWAGRRSAEGPRERSSEQGLRCVLDREGTEDGAWWWGLRNI